MQLAARLGLDYREGLIKNRYVGRTFIMPGQAVRRKSVRQKLNAIGMEFKGRTCCWWMIPSCGTTSREIVDMARRWRQGLFRLGRASGALPQCGIDMPTQQELIATGRSDEEIARTIGADALVYQDLRDMQQAVRDVNPALSRFEASCFDGEYVTGDITAEYLARLGQSRGQASDGESAGGLQFNMGYGQRRLSVGRCCLKSRPAGRLSSLHFRFILARRRWPGEGFQPAGSQRLPGRIQVRQIQPQVELVLVILRFHALAQAIERLVVLFFLQVRQLVHHDHAQEFLGQVAEQRRHADLVLGLEFAALHARYIGMLAQRMLTWILLSQATLLIGSPLRM